MWRWGQGNDDKETNRDEDTKVDGGDDKDHQRGAQCFTQGATKTGHNDGVRGMSCCD